MATIFYTRFDSPIGELLLLSDGSALCGLQFADRSNLAVSPHWRQDEQAAPFAQAREQLRAYFQGELTAFDLPLAPQGTVFQRKIWALLGTIPYGQTRSYTWLSEQYGDLKAIRAVGLANGRNPLAIIVPCHRVIGADGSLVGYGGGLERKAALLAFERRVLARGPQPFVWEKLAPGAMQATLF